MRTTIRLAAVAAVAASIGVALSAAPAAAEQVGTDDVKLTTGVDPRDVQVAYDPVNDRHLIVWDEASGAPETIRGQIVDNAGGLVSGPFTIGQSPVSGFVGEPAVTWDVGANRWWVAYSSDDTVVGEREIYVNTVSAAGSPGVAFRVSDMGDGPIVFDTANFDAQQPDIVYNATAGEAFVVWRGDDTSPGDGEDEIWGQRLGSGLTEVGTNDFRVSTLGTDGNTLTDARAPQVAWHPTANTYAVAYEQQDSLVPVAIWVAPVTATGTPGAAQQVVSGAAGTTETARATIAADDVGTGFLIAYELFTVATNIGSIAGRTFSTGDVLGGTLSLSTGGVDSLSPDLTYNPTSDRYGLVFHADALAGPSTEFEIYGSLLTTTGTVAESLERLSTMGVDGTASSVTVNAAAAPGAGGRVLAVWQSDDTTAGDIEVFGQYFQVNVPPTVTINQAIGQADPTNASPVSFTVVFSEPVVGFTNADISTTGSTATVGSIAVSGSGPTYTVTVAVSGNGTLTASIPASAVTDAGGLLNSASTSTDNTVTIDTTVPTVTVDEAVGQADPTNSSTVDFTAVFSEPVAGFTIGDISLAGSTATGGTVSIIGAGPTYTVRVSGITGSGTVVVSIPASGATDAAGNGNADSTSTDSTVTVDLSAPSVTIEQAAGQSDPTNTGPIAFTATFSEPVTGFTAADVVLSASGAAGPLSATVTGTGPVYNVSVAAMTGDGTVIASIVAGAATDTAGNPSTVSTSTDNSVLYDAGVPTVTVTPISPDPTNANPVQYSVAFSEAVSGFTLGDIDFTGSTAGGTLAATVGAPTGNTYPVTVTGMTSPGEVAVSIGASAVLDLAGNPNSASNMVSITWENVAPTVTVDQAVGQADPTNNAAIAFTVVASEPLTGLVAADFTVGNGTPTSVAPTAVSGVYALTVTASGPGPVTASLAAGVATDAAGNGNQASTSTDNTVTYDPAPPTVTIDQAAGQIDPINGGPIAFTVVFSEPVTGFDGDDVELSASTVGGTLAASVSGSGTDYTVSVAGMTGVGDVIVTIPAGGATDVAGNSNVVSTSTDNTVTFDEAGSTVGVGPAPGQASPTNTDPIHFIVVFSEDVSGFEASDVTFPGHTAGGALAASVAGGPKNYTVDVSGMTTSGTVSIQVPAGSVQDAAGNPNTISGTAIVTWDVDVPTVTIDQAVGQSDPTAAQPIVFTAAFSEPIPVFASSAVSFAGSTAPGTYSVAISGQGTSTITISVSGIAGSGTVIASIPAGAVTDAAGNPNAASTSSDNEVTTTVPSFALEPAALDFGAVPLTASRTLDVLVRNTTGAPITVSMAGGGLTTPPGDFGNSQNCQGNTLAANATCTISYTFQPQSLAAKSLTNSFSLNGEPYSVDLTGVGVTGLAASPAALDFGDWGVGAVSTPLSVTITNTSSYPLSNLQMAGGGLSGPPADDYTNSQNCQGANLAPAASCTVTYQFTPRSLGVKAITNAFTIGPNGAAQPLAVSVDLTGTGVPAFAVTASVAFGDVPVGATSATMPATVTNVSGATLTNIQMAGGGLSSPPGDFANSQNCQGQTLANGASCSIFYTFSPQSLGAKAITNSFTLNGQPYAVALSGRGVNGLTPSTTSLDFGSLPAGSTSSPQQIVFTNSSTYTISNIQMAGGGLGGPTSDYSNSQSCQGATLAPGQTCFVQYQFHPRSVGTKAITNTFTLNSAPVAIDLTGVGTSPVTVTPANLTFAARLGGTTSASQTITVTNTSASTLTALDVTNLAAGDPANFGVTDHCDGVDLAPAGTCTIDVVFHPTAIGSLNSAVSLTMFGQSFSVAVSGTGLNDAPVLTSPASLTAELGVAVALSGANSVGVTDAFGTAMQVTLTTTDGTLSVPIAGVTVTGNGSASVTISGTPPGVNAALAGLTVTYTEVGARTIDIAASDRTFATVLTDTATIAVTVVDTTPPVITVPGASVLANSEPGKAGAHVTFTVIVTDRGSAPASNPGLTQAAAPTFTCAPSSGSFFPIGTTTVTCTAQDSVGNTSSASFSVVVSDTEKPTITPPATQRATLPRGATTIAVTYPVPTAADNSGQVTVSCVPASGSAFPTGTTTVTCTATDPSGNTAAASFSVVVTSGTIPPTGGGGSLVPAALATLLAGAFLVLATHRRRHHPV